jgi:hypothetical protein
VVAVAVAVVVVVVVVLVVAVAVAVAVVRDDSTCSSSISCTMKSTFTSTC